MPSTNKRIDFLTSDDGVKAAEILNSMVLDKDYRTDSSFSLNSEKYADNLMPFIDKHLAYLQNNPATNLEHYLSNLKLKTKIRR